MAGGSRELELLKVLGRVLLDDTRTARSGALLTGGLDWDYLLAQAGRHGLLPLLHWQLSRQFPGSAPPAAARVLAEQFQATVQSNLKLAAELVRVLKVFEAHNILALPFKGPTLAVAVYGNLALREFTDLDLLLQPPDILRARDLLLADGYLPEYDLTPTQEKAMLASACEYNFLKLDGQLHLELHWDIVPRSYGLRLDPESWMARRESVTLGSGTVPSLAPEDLLLVLCVHGAKHAWERLAWITDVAELLRTYPTLDLQRVAKQADAAGALRLLHLGLALSQRLLDSELPGDWLQQIQQDSHVQSMADEVCQGLTRSAREPWELHHFMLRGLRPGQRAAYLIRSALTSTPAEWNLVNLPAPLFPLYSVLRLARLTGKYAVRMLRGNRPESPQSG